MRNTAAWGLALSLLSGSASAQSVTRYGDWRRDSPGTMHRITPADLPAPYASSAASNGPRVIGRPAGAMPQVPPGFAVSVFASGLNMPRVIRVAPNGDVFVAESGADRILVYRPGEKAASVFAHDLSLPFGIAFYPPGPNPQFVYVADTDKLIRFAYHTGDLVASARPETILPSLPQGGHWTRDVVAAPDGQHLFLSVGSSSNVASGLERRAPEAIRAWEAAHGRGSAWGNEEGRADILVLDPVGHDVHVYATGLRNCSGEAIAPATGALWCATNERDGLGDDLPPDYVTRVQPGAFFGWPWYYIGGHEDPRHAGERPDLRDAVAVPDVLLQPHSAPLGIAFYDGTMFPPAYRGDAFVALHGSWNRALRTGYKVVRVRMQDGQPTGSYEDFLTGFVASDAGVWGRPVDVAVARDGSLLVSEDANGTIWRVSRP